MEISYKNTFWEILQFSFSYYFRSWIIRIVSLPMLYMFGDLAYDVAQKVDFQIVGKIITFLIVTCSGFGIFLLLMALLISISAFSSYRMHQNKWGMCKISIKKESLFAESSLGKSEINWSSITAIQKNKRAVNIYISKQMAYVIPKRAFAGETEFAQFYTMANEFWAKGGIEKSITK